MKLELKENMYVRTKDGIIAKIYYIDDNTIFFDKDLYRVYSDSINFLEKDNLERIAKISYSIIDILEVGDYVNGHEVKSKQSGVKRIDIGEDENYVWLYEKDIKSVITREQMEQMAYKVGE